MPLQLQHGAVTSTHGYQMPRGLFVVVFDPRTRMMNNRRQLDLNTQVKRVSHRTRGQHVHERVRCLPHTRITSISIGIILGIIGTRLGFISVSLIIIRTVLRGSRIVHRSSGIVNL